MKDVACVVACFMTACPALTQIDNGLVPLIRHIPVNLEMAEILICKSRQLHRIYIFNVNTYIYICELFFFKGMEV